MDIFNNLRELSWAWKKSKIASDTKVNILDFIDIEIGCSFNPEYWILEGKDYTPLFVLNYIHKDLKINSVRLGLRWNLIEQLDGTLNLDYYKPYLEYCVKNNLQLTLNLGPLKTMRWPEEHIPEQYLNLVRINKTISKSHPIAGISINYLNNLIDLLDKDFPDLSNQIVAVQGNNEAFNNFGHLGIKIMPEYEYTVINVLLSRFNRKNVLMNSSGLNDIRKIYNLAESLNFQWNKLIIGINYYYKVKYQHKIPLISRLDNIVIKKLFSSTVATLRKNAAIKGFQTEITELQGEPWWPNAITPGSSFNEFLFTLYRTRQLKPPAQKSLVISYWGIEYLITKLLSNDVSADQQKIANLISNINQKHVPVP